MSSKPEPAIWLRNTGQQISWYDSCQLNITWMSNVKAEAYHPEAFNPGSMLPIIPNQSNLTS